MEQKSGMKTQMLKLKAEVHQFAPGQLAGAQTPGRSCFTVDQHQAALMQLALKVGQVGGEHFAAQALTSAGVPHVIQSTGTMFSVFFDRLNAFFASKTKKISEMKKNFKAICALLAVDALTLNDGNAQLNDTQLSTIEDALSQKDSTIAELEAQIGELKKAPAVDTQKVVDEGKQNAPSAGKSGFELYCENYNAARKLYNEV